jgi:hypothetical protein
MVRPAASTVPHRTCVALILCLGALGPAQAQQTALTIYSTARPGAVPADLYRPVPGQGRMLGQTVPGYAMVRQTREITLEAGRNHLNFRDVAAYIDPTTVSFESLTAPASTRVIEQSFQFDLVSTEKLMDRYIDQVITVDQLAGNQIIPITGRLLSTQGGLILSDEGGQIHALQTYQGVHFPTLPGGLITRPTLVWDVLADRAGTHETRVTYQTAGLTWWADYNLVLSEGANAQRGNIDIGAWVSILNQSGASYEDAGLKLIAGDVNRVEPDAMMRARRAMADVMTLEQAPGSFEQRSFFEFHLYTLGRRTTLPDDSTKQIELFPKVEQVPAQRRLVYVGLPPTIGFFADPATERDYGLPMNSKVDAYLEFANEERYGLGIPLPAGRIRVSQLDAADGTLEFIGEDVIDHTPKDETVTIKLGSAFDVVGERRQVDFRADHAARWMEETIEVVLRNHKTEAVEVLVKERLFRWTNNDIVESSLRYERLDASTVQFPVAVAAEGERTLRYRVRYSW